MKMRLFFALLIGLQFACSTPSNSETQIKSVVPQPREIEYGESEFKVMNSLSVKGILPEVVVEQLANDFDLQIKQTEEKADLTIAIEESLDNNSAYEIQVKETGIDLLAKTDQGVFYGMQTLMQLMQKSNNGWVIPSMKINDFPQFQHRGLLLDCSRHFFEPDVVKKYIDLLAHYKMNVLHWHLTEDQGWRIEIDQYPKLTEVGAWRIEEDGSKYGGFYTKDEIREIVAYAAERFVTIIPEIELPGHSQAALAAYPEFSCLGEGIEVVNDWGVFKEIYCAGNEQTFDFLENVLTEVIELFPSEYIHIGGDEAPKYRWEHCAKCQKRILDEELHDEHELQSYFVKRIETFLNANGRKLIGWDEIMEGGLSPNATVQSWRGMEYGRDAARAEHQVIFSPTSHAYLDYDLKSIDLRKVYSFDPIPTDLEEKYHSYVLGAEVNMWTEHVPDKITLDQKVFPRLLALAEVIWTYDQERNFLDFFERVQEQYPYLKSKNVSYGLEGKAVNIGMNTDLKVELSPGVPGLDIQYAINDNDFIDYTAPIEVNFSGLLSAKAEKDGVAYGDANTQKMELHSAINMKPEMETEFNSSYDAGGEYGLTDGLLASSDFRDGRWQGYYGDHVSGVIDLVEIKSVKSVSANFYQYNNAWIFLPTKVEVQVSKDGSEWTKLGSSKPELDPTERGKFIEEMSVVSEDTIQARFIKFLASNRLKVPEWHEAAGSKAWLFIDEIIVK